MTPTPDPSALSALLVKPIEGVSRNGGETSAAGFMAPAPGEEISSATPTELLPGVPSDPWEATGTQSFAAELRIRRALRAKKQPRRRDLRQLLHDYGLAQMDGEVVGWLRSASRRVVGGNCAFVDGDLAILEHLAERAVESGLTDQLAPDVQRDAARALETQRAAEDTNNPADHSLGDGAHDTSAKANSGPDQ